MAILGTLWQATSNRLRSRHNVMEAKTGLYIVHGYADGLDQIREPALWLHLECRALLQNRVEGCYMAAVSITVAP